MAGAESESLSDVVLLFGNITGTEGVEKLSENTRYLFIPPSSNEGDHHESPRWKRHLIDELDGPIFAFRFGKDMESPLGWNLGSSEDLDQCDFQIVSREAKYTSKKHIRINIAPDTFCPRLTNLSRNPVRIYVGGRPIALEQGQQPIEILRSVEVKVGDVSLCMWRATLTTKEESVFRRNAEQFSREYLDAMPVPCAYAVKSGASTYNLRFGVDGTEYRQENAQPVSAGAFASVLKVRNMRTGTIYAAKMPHFRTTDMASTAQKRLESLRTEYDKIVRLDHVSRPVRRRSELTTGSLTS